MDTPMARNWKMSVEADSPVDKDMFEKAGGKFVYIAITRPDLLFQ